MRKKDILMKNLTRVDFCILHFFYLQEALITITTITKESLKQSQ